VEASGDTENEAEAGANERVKAPVDDAGHGELCDLLKGHVKTSAPYLVSSKSAPPMPNEATCFGLPLFDM
jgi:hypothetical protein